LERVNSTHDETIGERFAREALTLRPLPAVLPRACVTRYARVNKFAELCFERNWYSVPTQYAFRDAVIEVYEHRVRVVVGEEAVADHRRGFGSHERFLDPVHYVGLLAHKHRAAETALVLSDGRIPKILHQLFERYRDDGNGGATKRWTAVLSLLANASVADLAQTVTHALARGTDDPAAIAMLLRQRCNPAPARARELDPQTLPLSARIPSPPIDLTLYATAQLIESAA
jgi:hypothetical protein